MTRYNKSEVIEARDELIKLLPPGTVVYTLVTHVAQSDLQRRVRLFIVDAERAIREITGRVARVLGWGIRKGDLVVDGAGMDVCFHTVMQLSYVLHGRDGRGEGLTRHPREINPENFRAGYSLIKRDL